MMKAKLLASITVALLLGGCVQQPAGPTVAVMPAPYKPFEVFQQDQAICMAYGKQMTNGQAQAANTQSVGTAVVGTVLGAGLGAAIGGGTGAAIGAASGALGGTAGRRRPGEQRAGKPAAALRRRLFPMHVCQGQSGARLCRTQRAAAPAAPAELCGAELAATPSPAAAELIYWQPTRGTGCPS